MRRLKKKEERATEAYRAKAKAKWAAQIAWENQWMSEHPRDTLHMSKGAHRRLARHEWQEMRWLERAKEQTEKARRRRAHNLKVEDAHEHTSKGDIILDKPTGYG